MKLKTAKLDQEIKDKLAKVYCRTSVVSLYNEISHNLQISKSVTSRHTA